MGRIILYIMENKMFQTTNQVFIDVYYCVCPKMRAYPKRPVKKEWKWWSSIKYEGTLCSNKPICQTIQNAAKLKKDCPKMMSNRMA